MSTKPTVRAVPLDEMSPLLLGLIEQGVDVTFRVTGCSMSPLWANLRDSVVLTKCDPLKLKKGQVPFYRRANGKYILHRIIKVNKDTYNMIGDNQSEVEFDVPKSAVLCVVKGFYRKGKYYSCDAFTYRLYTFLWVNLRPLRSLMWGAVKILKKLFKGGKK